MTEQQSEANLFRASQAIVFFDASVLVAASRSPTGGSAAAIEVCAGARFRGAVTELILLEARTNIASKLGQTELLRFYQQLAMLNPLLVPPPSPERIAECVPLTTKKDAHVLAAALACNARLLLTLDRQHLLTPAVLAANLTVLVMTPGEFLQSFVRSEGAGQG